MDPQYLLCGYKQDKTTWNMAKILNYLQIAYCVKDIKIQEDSQSCTMILTTKWLHNGRSCDLRIFDIPEVLFGLEPSQSICEEPLGLYLVFPGFAEF